MVLCDEPTLSPKNHYRSVWVGESLLLALGKKLFGPPPKKNYGLVGSWFLGG